MTAESNLTPYFKEMTGLLDEAPMFDAVSEEQTGGASDRLKRFGSEKIENAGVLCLQDGAGTIQYGLCLVLPKAEYGLPIFISIWEEHADHIRFMVDLMPTVDTLVDEPYRVKYIESINDMWDRFASLPGIRPEEDDELRAACSIAYTAAQVPIEKEGQRLAALAAHTGYMGRYLEFLAEEEASTDPGKLSEIKRKRAAVLEIVKTHVHDFSKTADGQALGNGALQGLLNSLL